MTNYIHFIEKRSPLYATGDLNKYIVLEGLHAASQQQLSSLQEISAVANDLNNQAMDLQTIVSHLKI
ncbi:hypothetical protein ACIQXW_17745 [Lysinibacillus sp. NPDC097162]|uniref:hypothetical protein n=1 Tax=Lysinibacillus sp. NPDC097162 TaxID=3364140 RepID=UPI0037F1A170